MSKYEQIIEWVFTRNYQVGDVTVRFNRDELALASSELGFARIKNLGDIPYSFRFRRELPKTIQATAPENAEWIIVGTGIGEYAFRLASPGKIEPSLHYYPIKIPDATPEIVRHYAPGTDEQALLTRARYNRLIGIFTGLTCIPFKITYEQLSKILGRWKWMKFTSVSTNVERILCCRARPNHLVIDLALCR